MISPEAETPPRLVHLRRHSPGVLTLTPSPIIARYMKLRGSKKENESDDGGGGKKA